MQNAVFFGKSDNRNFGMADNTTISIKPQKIRCQNLGPGINDRAYERAIVIHGGADDYESQPSGDAGERIACAVIE